MSKKTTVISSGLDNEAGSSFKITVEADLMPVFKVGPKSVCGGTVSSDQLWAHLKTQAELQEALKNVKFHIKEWRASLKAHNDQPAALQRYCLKTGEPI